MDMVATGITTVMAITTAATITTTATTATGIMGIITTATGIIGITRAIDLGAQTPDSQGTKYLIVAWSKALACPQLKSPITGCEQGDKAPGASEAN